MIVTSVKPLTTSSNQEKSGMRIMVIPLQRMEIIVATMLMAVPKVPNPLTISASAQ